MDRVIFEIDFVSDRIFVDYGVLVVFNFIIVVIFIKVYC